MLASGQDMGMLTLHHFFEDVYVKLVFLKIIILRDREKEREHVHMSGLGQRERERENSKQVPTVSRD